MTCSYSKEFSTSAFTDIENAFITEYLPVSSGDAVKVYLYGLFLCQNPKFDKNLTEIAQTLSLSEETVLSCFTYWEEFGLVNVLSKDPLSVQYEPIRSSVSAKPKKIKAEKYSEFSKTLQTLLPNRMISTSEYTEYFNVMETYSIKPEAMIMIVNYCISLKGADIGYRYISKVAKDFGNRGLTTLEKVEKELSSYNIRTGIIERILKALKLRRAPEIEDSVLLEKWTDELEFEAENIIFAASKLGKGSMAKLDEFLLELFSRKSFSKEEIAEFIGRKKEVYDLAIKINKALAIYVEVLDTVIDTYLNKWLSFGFTGETLLLIANYLFKTGKNTLQEMDDLIVYLRNRGFIDLSSVNDYFEQLKVVDEFLNKMLKIAGVNRKPTSIDRENYTMWKSWNFSDDMILQASSLSAGKSSPISYMNGILSNWKNNGVYTLSSLPENNSINNDSQENYNREYERRRTLAVSRAQKNLERAMQIDGFMDAYGRLNGMEKDLAFAEFNDNKEMLIKLEKEKEELISKVETLLSSIKVTFDDLSPKYACSKCNDTGYVGTHRCDCFDKKVK